MVVCNHCGREVTYLLYDMQHRLGKCVARPLSYDLI